MFNYKVRKAVAIALLGATVFTTGAIAQNNAKKAPTAAQAKGTQLGSTWDDVKKMPDFFTGIWQSAAGMVDGKVNVGYTEAAKAYMAKYQGKADIPLANETCQTPGMPIIMRAQSPLKFMYEPGMISIYMEHASDTRFIYLNQKLPTSPNPTYLGNSVARWEGDTLVIESVGFNEDIVFQYGVKDGARMPSFGGGGPSGPPPGGPGSPGAAGAPGGAPGGFGLPPAGGGPGGPGGGGSFLSNIIFGPHGPNLRMVERMRLTDPNTLEWKLTIYDDTVFTGPYEADLHRYKRITGEMGKPQEWACTASISYYDEKTNASKELSPEEALKLLDSKVIK